MLLARFPVPRGGRRTAKSKKLRISWREKEVKHDATTKQRKSSVVSLLRRVSNLFQSASHTVKKRLCSFPVGGSQTRFFSLCASASLREAFSLIRRHIRNVRKGNPHGGRVARLVHRRKIDRIRAKPLVRGIHRLGCRQSASLFFK